MNILGDALRARELGYQEMQRGHEQRARNRAGRKLATRDYGGAAGELYGAGMLEEGSQAQTFGQAQDDRAADQKKQIYAERADALIKVSAALAHVEPGQRKATLDRILPTLGDMGMDTSILQSLQEEQLTDDNLRLFSGQVAKELEQFTLSPGSKRFDARGRLIAEAPFAPNYQKVGEGETLIQVNPGGTQGGASSPDDVWGAAIMQESGGRPGVLGPMTPYGQAQGLTQMLPKTAEAMAKKLNMPWRPDLMTGTTEEAANYQQRLGRAYFDEGLQKYNGDAEKALMYYHGGPDESLWGPKTQAHARAVLGRLSASQTAGPGAGSGATVIARGNPKPKRTYQEATPDQLRAMGYPPGTRAQFDSETGKLENIRQPTEAQTKATGYAKRMFGANDRLNGLAERGVFKPTPQLLISEKNGVTRIVASNPDDRQFLQASKEWLAPILRKDTGAAVTDGELLTYMDIYIPKPEDDIVTLRNKADARQDAMISLSQETGGLYGATYGNRSFHTMRPGGATAKGKRPALGEIFK